MRAGEGSLALAIRMRASLEPPAENTVLDLLERRCGLNYPILWIVGGSVERRSSLLKTGMGGSTAAPPALQMKGANPNRCGEPPALEESLAL